MEGVFLYCKCGEISFGTRLNFTSRFHRTRLHHLPAVSKSKTTGLTKRSSSEMLPVGYEAMWGTKQNRVAAGTQRSCAWWNQVVRI